MSYRGSLLKFRHADKMGQLELQMPKLSATQVFVPTFQPVHIHRGIWHLKPVYHCVMLTFTDTFGCARIYNNSKTFGRD